VTSHYSEDDLTLYYYGEGRRRAQIERHLQDCAACQSLYREISSTLALITAPEVPERGDQYGLEVWQRIRNRLPERQHGFARFSGFSRFWGFSGFAFPWNRVALAAGVALLAIAMFVAGYLARSPQGSNTGELAARTNPANPANPTNPENPANPGKAERRILLTAVADHLERSERVLTDIMNAPDLGHGTERGDISSEQRWAEDLLATSRLYRQDAVDAGEQSVATILDDLERSLLEIVHSPSKISAADLEQIRRRIDAAALLFKVRVMSDELRRREAGPADRSASRTSTSKIS
jgi:hypothetical protein